MQQRVLPGKVKALVEEEEALYAAAPLAGGRCKAQAAPSHLTHLLPDMLSLCIQETISTTILLIVVVSKWTIFTESLLY